MFACKTEAELKAQYTILMNFIFSIIS